MLEAAARALYSRLRCQDEHCLLDMRPEVYLGDTHMEIAAGHLNAITATPVDCRINEIGRPIMC